MEVGGGWRRVRAVRRHRERWCWWDKCNSGASWLTPLHWPGWEGGNRIGGPSPVGSLALPNLCCPPSSHLCIAVHQRAAEPVCCLPVQQLCGADWHPGAGGWGSLMGGPGVRTFWSMQGGAGQSGPSSSLYKGWTAGPHMRPYTQPACSPQHGRGRCPGRRTRCSAVHPPRAAHAHKSLTPCPLPLCSLCCRRPPGSRLLPTTPWCAPFWGPHPVAAAPTPQKASPSARWGSRRVGCSEVGWGGVGWVGGVEGQRAGHLGVEDLK